MLFHTHALHTHTSSLKVGTWSSVGLLVVLNWAANSFSSDWSSSIHGDDENRSRALWSKHVGELGVPSEGNVNDQQIAHTDGGGHKHHWKPQPEIQSTEEYLYYNHHREPQGLHRDLKQTVQLQLWRLPWKHTISNGSQTNIYYKWITPNTHTHTQHYEIKLQGLLFVDQITSVI